MTSGRGSEERAKRERRRREEEEEEKRKRVKRDRIEIQHKIMKRENDTRVSALDG